MRAYTIPAVLTLSLFVVRAPAQPPPTTSPTTQPSTTVTEQSALDFLLADLPARDVGSVTYDQSVRNTQLALAARDRAPWKDTIPDEVFLNYVLPHCVITERRDNWRENFYQRFSGLIR